MKDFLAESYFEKGWEGIDRHFRKLSGAADSFDADGDPSPEDISRALDRLASQVELFADNWVHFHMRFEALMREYNISQASQDGGDGALAKVLPD